MILWLLLLSLSSASEVVDSAAGGFTVRHSARVAAPAGVVFDELVGEVGKWWDPAHTWSGSSGNLSIEASAGGCFCEKLSDGGSVQHLTVVYIKKPEMLRLSGGLGPLQGMGVAGALTFSLSESDGGTDVTLEYRVSGYSPDGLHTIAPAVDQVLGIQLRRLRDHVEGR